MEKEGIVMALLWKRARGEMMVGDGGVGTLNQSMSSLSSFLHLRETSTKKHIAKKLGQVTRDIEGRCFNYGRCKC